MEQIRIIPAYIHGILDYLTAILLLLAPNLFGFEEYGGAAVWIPRILGVAILVMALLTNYRPGMLHVIPMSIHLLVDYCAGAFLAISPFIFGFADQPANVWLPHLIAGLYIFIVTLLTQTTPEPQAAERIRASS